MNSLDADHAGFSAEYVLEGFEVFSGNYYRDRERLPGAVPVPQNPKNASGFPDPQIR
jgi:hypothetical protein